jgi:hypothetical protein
MARYYCGSRWWEPQTFLDGPSTEARLALGGIYPTYDGFFLYLSDVTAGLGPTKLVSDTVRGPLLPDRTHLMPAATCPAGLSPPGDPYWTPDTLAAIARRYPGFKPADYASP